MLHILIWKTKPFAFKIPYNPFTGKIFEKAFSPGDFYEPHEGSIRSYHRKPFFPSWAESDIISNVKKDGQKLGFTIEKIADGNGEVSNESWIVALTFQWGGFPSHLYDYHWYRKEADGSWWQQTSKGGDIKSTDASDALISDPKTCNRAQYNVFWGYYRVTLTQGDTLMRRIWGENDE